MTNTTPVFPGTLKSSKALIQNSDASGLVTLVTGATNGSKVIGLVLSSTDTTARDITVGITRSAVFYPLGTVTVPITAGTIAATASVNAFSSSVIPGLPRDADGQAYILLESTDTLQFKALTTVTSTKAINGLAVHGDF